MLMAHRKIEEQNKRCYFRSSNEMSNKSIFPFSFAFAWLVVVIAIVCCRRFNRKCPFIRMWFLSMIKYRPKIKLTFAKLPEQIILPTNGISCWEKKFLISKNLDSNRHFNCYRLNRSMNWLPSSPSPCGRWCCQQFAVDSILCFRDERSICNDTPLDLDGTMQIFVFGLERSFVHSLCQIYFANSKMCLFNEDTRLQRKHWTNTILTTHSKHRLFRHDCTSSLSIVFVVDVCLLLSISSVGCWHSVSVHFDARRRSFNKCFVAFHFESVFHSFLRLTFDRFCVVRFKDNGISMSSDFASSHFPHLHFARPNQSKVFVFRMGSRMAVYEWRIMNGPNFGHVVQMLKCNLVRKNIYKCILFRLY